MSVQFKRAHTQPHQQQRTGASQICSGINRSAIHGQSLYACPASRPATKAPENAVTAMAAAAAIATGRTRATAFSAAGASWTAWRCNTSMPVHTRAEYLGGQHATGDRQQPVMLASNQALAWCGATYVANAIVKCAARRYGLTRGSSPTMVSLLSPDFTIHHPTSP